MVHIVPVLMVPCRTGFLVCTIGVLSEAHLNVILVWPIVRCIFTIAIRYCAALWDDSIIYTLCGVYTRLELLLELSPVQGGKRSLCPFKSALNGRRSTTAAGEALPWAHIAPSTPDPAAPSGNPTSATDDASSATTATTGATSTARAASATASGLKSFSSTSAHQVTPISIFRRRS